jgi:hypothetical protein
MLILYIRLCSFHPTNVRAFRRKLRAYEPEPHDAPAVRSGARPIAPAVQAARSQGADRRDLGLADPIRPGRATLRRPVDFTSTGQTMARMAGDILGADGGAFAVLS